MPKGKFSKVSIGERIGCLEVVEVIRGAGAVRAIGNQTKATRGKFYTDGVQNLCVTDWGKLWGLANSTARAKIARLVAKGSMYAVKQ